MVPNSGADYRIVGARKEQKLPMLTELNEDSGVEYNSLRHRMCSTLTAGAFTRLLASQWKLKYSKETLLIQPSPSSSCGDKMTPMFRRNAVQSYNRDAHKLRRIDQSRDHNAISRKAAYCSLCSWTFTFKYRNKT